MQDHGYVVRVEGSDVEKRVDLDPAKQRPESHLLTKRSEWQLMPNQPSVTPYCWDAMVCSKCYSLYRRDRRACLITVAVQTRHTVSSSEENCDRRQ